MRTRTRWILRCRDLLSRERFITTSVDKASARVHLVVPTATTPVVLSLSSRDVSRLRRQLADAQAVVLDLTGFDEDATA